MKGYLKLLPLCLAIFSCAVLADTVQEIKEKKQLSYDMDRLRNTVAIYNKNAFVNLEIHEFIINNVDKSFDNIDEIVKQTKTSVELDKYLQTLGIVQSSTTFNFNGVPNDQDTLFENSYIKSHLVKTNTQSNKKNEAGLTYNNVERSNAYFFNVGLKRLMGDSIQMTFNGISDTEHVVTSGTPLIDNDMEKTKVHNIFKQTSAIKLNEYAIISHDVKSSGVDNKTRENRFFIVKITESNIVQQ